MQAIFDMFNERIQEIDLYFEALKELDQGNTEHLDAPFFDSEFIKILKANTLLMVYNLVESTVMGGILEIYDKLKQEGLTYSDVRKEIKDISPFGRNISLYAQRRKAALGIEGSGTKHENHME